MMTAGEGRVNCWNWANLGLYLLNVLVFGLAYIRQLPGAGSPSDVLFVDYPTLITPGEVALQIVPVMFILDGIFVFFQLLPWFRNSEFVQLITPWWVALNLLQIQWVVDLSRETPGSIAYAMVCCLGMVAAVLGMILVVDARKPTFWQFWFLRMPFSIKAGWLIFASIANVNVWLVSQTPKFDDSVLLASAMISLALIFMITALFSLNTRRPDPLICLPVGWCMFWVWLNQSSRPSNMPDEMVLSTEIACAHCFTGVFALFVMAFLLRFAMVCVSNKLPEAFESGGIENLGQSVFL